ncbi:Mth938-like domain-containing protein [Chitinimonas sp. JJ19]|uniref:Mth938-like domain-containing protein n=1 Tax=Chitinimonas sp. JJ19 TaxID=3109352 RepID=UPI001A3B5DEA|nr:Mth938-like domain-containing protein [Chitinimonas sp.]
MKLHADKPTHLNVFTGYGADFVSVNEQRRSGSLVVSPTSVDPWRPASFAELTEADFEALLAFQPEVVLLGTGSRLQFPHPRLSRALMQAQVGVDAMDISALCRTFNILVAEDRRVIAAVLFE